MKSQNKNIILKKHGLAELVKIMKILGDYFYMQAVDIDKLSYRLSKILKLESVPELDRAMETKSLWVNIKLEA